MQLTPDSDEIPDWDARLDHVVETMRQMSRHSEPQAMVALYAERMRRISPIDRLVSLTRRGIAAPSYRIARCSTWSTQPDPWHETHALPILAGGLFGELMDAEKPRIIDHLDVPQDDPASEYFADMRSLVAIPVFDGGVAQNLVVFMRRKAEAFDRKRLAETVLTTNLLGRVTHNLVLADELRRVNAELDRELESVAEIQRALLPRRLPEIAGLDLGASYRTSRHAGGDYYDVFALPGNRWGFLIADVAGHGTPAAVLMAITHSLAHTFSGPPGSPSDLLEFMNMNLTSRYTLDTGLFVTAFYGVYDPAPREFVYASAGHNPPRLSRGGRVTPLDLVGGPPAGVVDDQTYESGRIELVPGDRLLLYTDGLTDARDRDGAFFGLERIDRALTAPVERAQPLVAGILAALDAFRAGRPTPDDITLMVAMVS